MNDLRVDQIRELIDSGDYDVLSLDLFDTVVYRSVPAPTDVFLLLGRELQERGWIRASSSPASFARERVGAEERARLSRATLEVTLADIYTEFPRGYLDGVTTADVADAEFEFEARMVHVNPDMRDLIEHARKRGLTLAYVSDTYFTGSQLDALVGIDADHRIVSCEEGLGKFQGLHRVLLERTGVAPERILHVGNNARADVEGPSAFGLDRYWFREWPEGYEHLLERELPSHFSPRLEQLGGPDGGLTTVRSRVMNATENEHQRWGAGILGPLVLGFSDWILDRCRDLEIDVALCLMREGRVFKQALDRQQSGLETRELFVSRFSARKAAIFEASPQELETFLLRPSPLRRGKILEQLGLEPGNVAGDPDEVLTSAETRMFLHEIANDAVLRKRVAEDSARARAGLVAHLRAVLGESFRGRAAVIDLGYKGTIQECLQAICDHEGLGIRTHGLYLVTGGKVHETQSTGAVVEGWLAENGQPTSMAHTFMRSPEVAEQSLMAPCGTTLGHAPDGTPVLDELRVPAEQNEQMQAVQRGILQFAAAWADHKAELGTAWTAPAISHYRSIAVRTVARPLPRELELFGPWTHDENFGSGDARKLMTPIGLTDWEQGHISAHQIASLPMSRIHWPFGFAHRMSPVLGESVAQIYLRTAAPETFDSGHPEQVLAAYWDTGNGFNADEVMLQTYRLNSRGRVWQRFTLRLDRGRPRQLGFSIGLPGQVLELTGVAMIVDGDESPEAVLRLEHDAIEKSGYRRAVGNLYQVESDPPLLIVPAPGLPESARTLSVDIFFGLMPGA